MNFNNSTTISRIDNGNVNRIHFGDKLFVRIMFNGSSLLEFTTNAIASMTDLIAETRRKLHDFQGLCTFNVRNMSQGWSTRKPLMIYPQSYRRVAPQTRTAHIPFPWETH
ncbi:MAG: hypothetical protein K2G11_09640 [Muribaculaceae bacterium]|nr:hypothetical protein [Muribaculaceae bacterium]